MPKEIIKNFDMTDVEIACDADLNSTWKKLDDESTPSKKLAIGEAELAHRREKMNEMGSPPPQILAS